MTSFLVGSVLNASVETLLMGPLTVFATLDLLEIHSPSALVRCTLIPQIVLFTIMAILQTHIIYNLSTL